MRTRSLVRGDSLARDLKGLWDSYWVAVGTLVAQRPPHRSARAAVPHAALTADAWRRSADWDTDEGLRAAGAIGQ